MNKLTKGEATHQLIYNSAVALFRKKGYNNVSVDEIARKAGIAKGTFYVHFESKAAIITQLFTRYDAYYQEIESQMDKNDSVMDRLLSFIGASCTFTENSIGLDMIRVLYQNQLVEGVIEQDAMKSDRTLYRIIHDLILEGQQTGVFRNDISLEDLEVWIIRSIRGMFYEWAMKEGAFSLTEETLRYVRAFCEGIRQ